MDRDFSGGLAQLQSWGVDDAAVPVASGARRRKPKRYEVPPFEAPSLQLLRAEDAALVLRWEPRWERLAEALTNVSKDSRSWKDDRASNGRVKFDRLGVAEVRSLVLVKHKLDDFYGDDWADLKVDGARLAAVRKKHDLEALGVTYGPHANKLFAVARKYAADGVEEKVLCELFRNSARSRQVLETGQAVKDATFNLEVFRPDLPLAKWESCYAGPGAGCRVCRLDAATRYRFRIAVHTKKGQISKYGAYAFATTGPAPPPPSRRRRPKEKKRGVFRFGPRKEAAPRSSRRRVGR